MKLQSWWIRNGQTRIHTIVNQIFKLYFTKSESGFFILKIA